MNHLIYIISFFGLFIWLGACNQGMVPSDSKSAVEFFTKEARSVIGNNTKLEKLANGFDWAEGPVWIGHKEMLLFSDIPPNMIYRWTETGGVETYLNKSGFTGAQTDSPEPGSNGLLYGLDSTLILCQHGDRRVSRMRADLDNPKPFYETLASNYRGKRLNSPNDIVQRSNGYYYFTDPPYGLKGQDENPDKQLDFCGVYLLRAPYDVTLLTDQMTRPNGLAFSPDEKTLYVANSDPGEAIWKAFTVDADGLITEERTFYDATNLVGRLPGLPDGLKVHPSGLVFATGPGGIFVFTPQGQLSAKIHLAQATANCAFDDDYEFLYITSDSLLYRMPLKANN